VTELRPLSRSNLASPALDFPAFYSARDALRHREGSPTGAGLRGHVPDTLPGEAIAAWVVCPAGRFDAEAIRSHCLARLSLFTVPRRILRVPDIPRTVSGKRKYYVLREQYQGLKSSSE